MAGKSEEEATVRTTLTQEFIGRDIIITDGVCQSLIGMQGRIINETKNTFTIEMCGKIKKIIKAQIKARIGGSKTTITGKDISIRGTERLKQRI